MSKKSSGNYLRRVIRSRAGIRQYGQTEISVLVSMGFKKSAAEYSLKRGLTEVRRCRENESYGDDVHVDQVLHGGTIYAVLTFSGRRFAKRQVADVTGDIVYLLVTGCDDKETFDKLMHLRSGFMGLSKTYKELE